MSQLENTEVPLETLLQQIKNDLLDLYDYVPDNFDDYFVGEIDLVRDGDRMVTANYDSAAVRFSFDFDGRARILSIRYY